MRGKISPLVIDALASLAAIAIDRHQWFDKEERMETTNQGEQLRATVMDALAQVRALTFAVVVVAVTPDPLTGTFGSTLLAVVEMLSAVEDSAPTFVGFKDTFTVQLAPPARALFVQAPVGLTTV